MIFKIIKPLPLTDYYMF